jgi:hypothetical protein
MADKPNPFNLKSTGEYNTYNPYGKPTAEQIRLANQAAAAAGVTSTNVPPPPSPPPPVNIPRVPDNVPPKPKALTEADARAYEQASKVAMAQGKALPLPPVGTSPETSMQVPGVSPEAHNKSNRNVVENSLAGVAGAKLGQKGQWVQRRPTPAHPEGEWVELSDGDIIWAKNQLGQTPKAEAPVTPKAEAEAPAPAPVTSVPPVVTKATGPEAGDVAPPPKPKATGDLRAQLAAEMQQLKALIPEDNLDPGYLEAVKKYEEKRKAWQSARENDTSVRKETKAATNKQKKKDKAAAKRKKERGLAVPIKKEVSDERMKNIIGALKGRKY